jgi:hypothetical protein
VDTFDFQTAFNLALTLLGFAFGYILKSITDGVKENRDEIARVKDEAAKRAQAVADKAASDTSALRERQDTYAVKDDVKEGFKRIEDMITRFFGELHNKVDKT